MTQFDQRYQHVETQYNADEINIHQQPLSLTEKRRRRNRTRMLERVQAIWIGGVLEPSVQGTAQIALALQYKLGAIVTPLWDVLREFDKTGRLSSAEVSIVQVYDHASGEVLILGEPGAGKTTLLLELTRALLERARQDETHPIPVVFPLSSWGTRRQPLTEWLASELHTRYQVPLPLATSWIETDQVLPLLDGLDEVAAPHRVACVEAINTYRQAHGLLPTVVCSRQTDYLVLSTRLLLRIAVVVQPLTPEQIESYLTSGGRRLETLRQTLREDVDLQALASTPLMLNVLTVAYQGTNLQEIAVADSPETKQEQVFASYVQRMLTRRSAAPRYTPEQTIRWLSSLADQMKRQSQTIFYLEQMQPTWLSDHRMRRVYDWLAVRLPAVLIGILVSLTISVFIVGTFALPTFTPFILLGGLLGGLLSEGSIPQRPAVSGGKTGNILGPRLLLGLLIGALIGLGNGLGYGLGAGLGLGLSYGLCSILLLFLLGKNNPAETRSPTSPPTRGATWQRLIRRREVHNGLIVGLIVGLTTGLSFGLIVGLITGLSFGLNVGLTTGLVNGLSFGLTTGVLSVLLIGRSTAVQPTDLLSWSWRSLGKSLFSKSHISMTVRVAVLIGLSYGLGSGLNAGQNYGLIFGLSYGLSYGLGYGLSYGLGLGLSVGLIYWLLFGLFQGVSSVIIEDQRRMVPNQGIRRSALNGLMLGLISTVIIGLFGGLSYVLGYGLNAGLNYVLSYVLGYGLNAGLNYGLSYVLGYALPTALLVGLLVGLLIGLLKGGLASLRHYVLRYLLWCTDSVPWHYIPFLDHAAERILLRKVGGGYIFIHRLLLDYFVSLATPFPEEVSPVSTISAPSSTTFSAPQTDSAHREEAVSPPAPSRKTDFNKKSRIVTLFVVVFLLLVLVSGASIFSVVQPPVQNTIAQIEANNATATAQVETNTTAEKLANASPITYPPQNKSPVLNDPLQDNSEGNGWEEDTSNGDCKFIHQAFDINININHLEWCPARATDFTNFIYEVQMKIVKGDGGGIAFRIDPTSENRFYYFAISQDGSYSVQTFTDGHIAALEEGSSSAIHQGLNRTNLVAAVVHGKIIELYVNLKRIAVVINSTYTHGLIGVIVSGFFDQTEVIFRNAKVWTL